MSDAITILVLWALFGASHVLLSSVWLRPRLVGAIGERTYAALFSILALAIFVPLVWFYFAHQGAGPRLWVVAPSPALLWLLYVGFGVAFVLAVGALVTPSPVVMGAPKREVRGVQRLTRHGLFMGLALWGALHLVLNGHASDVAFFAGFPIFALLGSWHQDRRKLLTGGPEFRRFYDETPFIPFTGRNTLRGMREFSPIALAAGIALTVLLRVYHAPLFG